MRSNAQVGINTTSPDASAILDLFSTSQGLLIPRMNDVERNAINNPADGLWIYNTDTDGFNYFNGTNWMEIVGAVVFSLDCLGANITGSLTEGVVASGVSAALDYTGANGDPHGGQVVVSTNITGLTATLAAGNFAVGSGTLNYTITGTPSSYGTANFAIAIGGETCTLIITVSPVLVVGCPGTFWMDRNLGASQAATASNDALAYGDLYQWGRSEDGHQLRTSNESILEAVSANDDPEHGDFIITVTLPGDWRIPQNDNLWQGETGINNPCPSGMRIPTQTEVNCERLSWSSQDAAGAFSSSLKLTVAGRRFLTNGDLAYVGDTGDYWTSTTQGTDAWLLRFTSLSVTVGFFYRATGMSIRCIKD